MKSIDTIEESTDIVYPESDGAPLGENTKQVKWIIALHNGFEGLLRKVPNVFLASDLFWYPVKGKPKIVRAPDVMMAFGRPLGDRSSYLQWNEENIAPQVVWEVRSPSNTEAVLAGIFKFYQQYDVEEYYLYDPELDALDIWVRNGKRLVPVPQVTRFVSPRLGIRFEFPRDGDMKVIGPDSKPFQTYQELLESHERGQRLKEAAFAKLRELGIDPDSLT